jgi:hypothetical protein
MTDIVEMIRDGIEEAAKHDGDTRSCTCHPDDNPPVPCPQKYALSECRHEALRLERDALLAALTAHQAFFDDVCSNCFGSDATEAGSDLEYSDFLEIGVKHGVLKVEKFDPATNKNPALAMMLEPGEDWYTQSGIARAALTASKATGERS